MPFRFWSGRVKKNPKTESLNLEIDEIRAKYPDAPLSNQGWYNYGASQVYTALLSAVPSTKMFLLRSLIIDNRQVANQLYFYDASGANVSATMFGMQIAPSTTGFIDLPDLQFIHGVYVSNLDSQASLRVTGLLVASGE